MRCKRRLQGTFGLCFDSLWKFKVEERPVCFSRSLTTCSWLHLGFGGAELAAKVLELCPKIRLAFGLCSSWLKAGCRRFRFCSLMGLDFDSWGLSIETTMKVSVGHTLPLFDCQFVHVEPSSGLCVFIPAVQKVWRPDKVERKAQVLARSEWSQGGWVVWLAMVLLARQQRNCSWI
jgi:hypothetical protein